MIDLGLTKMALVGVVALVVIGPEKLPKVARMAGSLFGRAQRYINEVKSEVSREIELDELRKMQKEVEEAARSAGRAVHETVNQLDADLNSAWHDKPAAEPTIHNPLLSTPTPDQFAAKFKDFRRKRLARTSALPAWYKNRSGQRARVVSGAARVARFTPKSRKSPGSFFS